jgi:hypothetical protein
MKISVLAIVLLVSGSMISGCQARQVITDEQAIQALRQFYINYITYKSEGAKDGYKRMDSLLLCYSTPRLTEQMSNPEDQDDDFIVNITGADTGWLKTLKVIKDKTAKDIYDVSWVYQYFPGENKKPEINTIKLQLIKTPTGILIDQIVDETIK